MTTRRAALAPLAVLPAALLALGACAPTYDGVEPEEFAQVACSGWTSWLEADAATHQLDMQLTGTGEEQKEQVIAAAEGVLAAVQQARDDVAEAQPAVEDGAAIIALFTDYYDERLEVTTARIDEFREFPAETGPNDDEIRIESLDVMGDVGEYGDGQPDGFPFTDIEDQDVITALGEEPTCEELVRVF